MITPGRQEQPLRYLRHDACPMVHHPCATLHSSSPVEASHLPDGVVLPHKTPAVRSGPSALKKLVCLEETRLSEFPSGFSKILGITCQTHLKQEYLS